MQPNQETEKPKHRFVCEWKRHPVTIWYEEGGEVLAMNTDIMEYIPECGEQPPGFSRFRGSGETEVETVMGVGVVKFQFDIPNATTVEEAAEQLEEAEAAARPSVIQSAKEEAIEQVKKARSALALPGMPGMPGAPQGGPKLHL
jgi:hypothetical protein